MLKEEKKNLTLNARPTPPYQEKNISGIIMR